MQHKEHEVEGRTLPEYGQPAITDYGTLVDLTEAGHVANSDVPYGNASTAYPPAYPS